LSNHHLQCFIYIQFCPLGRLRAKLLLEAELQFIVERDREILQHRIHITLQNQPLPRIQKVLPVPSTPIKRIHIDGSFGGVENLIGAEGDPSERAGRENDFVAESETWDETCFAVLGVLAVLAHP
jgi:hypothetical protein